MSAAKVSGWGPHMRSPGVQIPLRRAEVFVAGQFLRDDGIACVLESVRYELVADGVPCEALAAAVIYGFERMERTLSADRRERDQAF